MVVFVVPPTVAVNPVEKPAFTVATAGEIIKVTGAVLTVTVADEETAVLLIKVAVTVAIPPLGAVAGLI
jgi:hypothetical protein